MSDQDMTQASAHGAFLATKLFIPRTHAKLVVRPALIDKLNTAHRYKMTLVSAPAGFGKTTLLTQWIGRLGDPVAWLSLDEKDNDPYVFLHYLIGALQSVDAALGVTALRALQSSKKQTLAAVLIPLLNDISKQNHELYLILDDYHCIESADIHEMLGYMLGHLPPRLHLILSTRADPPLPLAKMRARNTLCELRIKELCFVQEDIDFLFNEIMELGLSPKEIVTLEERTEGWAAGLQLAAISLQGSDDISGFIRAFSGDNRYIADYLVEEVLSRQDEQVHDFLLRTSFLRHISAELCDALLGRANSQSILESLEQQNLFIISLDSKRKWFRYHHLFADLLFQRLLRRGKAVVSELRQVASRWHEEQGSPYAAIDYALAAEDYGQAAKLLGAIVDHDWEHGTRSRIYGWFENIPVEYIYDNPDLCLLHAWVLLDDNKRQAAETSLAKVESVIRQQESGGAERELSPTALDEIRGKVGVLRALMETGRGNVRQILVHAEEALQYLPEHTLTWRANALLARGIAYSLKGDLDGAVDAYVQSMELSRISGNLDIYFRASVWLIARLTYAAQLDRAIRICDMSFAVVKEKKLEQSLFSAGVYLSKGNILYERNRLEEAHACIKKDFEIIEAALDINHKAWCYCCMMKVLTASKDFAAAAGIIARLEELESEYQLPFSFSFLTGSLRAKIWLLQEEMDKVGDWLTDNDLSMSDEIVAYRDLGHAILARYLFAQHKIDEAKSLLERLVNKQEDLGRTLVLIEVLLIQAQVLERAGERESAAASLARALHLAKPGDCIRVFLNEGRPLAAMLARLLNEKIEIPRSFTKKLLTEFKLEDATESEREPPILSGRELEILRLIAAGLSNKKITETLYISLSTVKTHLRNIYSKLDAHSRTEAVAKANARNLL